MPSFQLKIKLGNEAMQTADDVARALKKAADRIEHGSHPEGLVIDDNGNRVGEWKFIGSTRAKNRVAGRDPRVGRRVEIHPGSDTWMRGARYGVITRIDKAGIAHVRMDNPRIRRLHRALVSDLKFI